MIFKLSSVRAISSPPPSNSVLMLSPHVVPPIWIIFSALMLVPSVVVALIVTKPVNPIVLAVNLPVASMYPRTGLSKDHFKVLLVALLGFMIGSILTEPPSATQSLASKARLSIFTSSST